MSEEQEHYKKLFFFASCTSVQHL